VGWLDAADSPASGFAAPFCGAASGFAALFCGAVSDFAPPFFGAAFGFLRDIIAMVATPTRAAAPTSTTVVLAGFDRRLIWGLP
jgi:hypothetical protein